MDDTLPLQEQGAGASPITENAPAAHGLWHKIKAPARAFLDHRLAWSDLGRPVRFLKAHWPVLGLVPCLGYAIWLLVPSFSSETPVPQDLAGLFHGTYVSGLDEQSLRYDLYFPPQFTGKQGPFPLIIFLAGYGERDGNLKIGLVPFIRKQVKERGHFDFVAFFPIKIGLRVQERTMEMLDYVIAKHRIDPGPHLSDGPLQRRRPGMEPGKRIPRQMGRPRSRVCPWHFGHRAGAPYPVLGLPGRGGR